MKAFLICNIIFSYDFVSQFGSTVWSRTCTSRISKMSVAFGGTITLPLSSCKPAFRYAHFGPIVTVSFSPRLIFLTHSSQPRIALPWPSTKASGLCCFGPFFGCWP